MSKYGAQKAAIIAAHNANPDWPAPRIAQHVGCPRRAVYNARDRYSLAIPTRDYGV